MKKVLVLGPKEVHHPYWLEVAGVIGQCLAASKVCMLTSGRGAFIEKAKAIARENGGETRRYYSSCDGLIMVGGDMERVEFFRALVNNIRRDEIRLGLLRNSAGATDFIISALPTLRIPEKMKIVVERNPVLLVKMIVA